MQIVKYNPFIPRDLIILHYIGGTTRTTGIFIATDLKIQLNFTFIQTKNLTSVRGLQKSQLELSWVDLMPF